MDGASAAKAAAQAKTRALAERDVATAAHQRIEALAPERKTAEVAETNAKAQYAKHRSAAQLAFVFPVKPPPKGKRAPLPKLAALEKGGVEYDATVQQGVAQLKASDAIQKSEAELDRQLQVATRAVDAAKAAKQASDAAVKRLGTIEQERAANAKKDKSAAAADDAAAAKAANAAAKLQAKDTAAAVTVAEQELRKAVATARLGTAAAIATKVKARQTASAKLEAELGVARQALAEVTRTRDAHNPKLRGCDIHKVDWKNASFPWLQYWSNDKPLVLKDGQTARCEEDNQDYCPGIPPSLLTVLYGDLDKDGKDEAIVPLFVGSGDVPEVSSLFFAQDANCRLRYLGSVNTRDEGTLANGVFSTEQIFAKPGENIGLGEATGQERLEFRLVNGAITSKRTVLKGP